MGRVKAARASSWRASRSCPAYGGTDRTASATATASTRFVTPIGDQTNTMVYGMGGCRFAWLGPPVTLVSLAAIVIFVSLFWPR